MASLRKSVVWLLVLTQFGMPVLAQTLPITVDKSGAGQRPVVGVTGNGVPVVNITAPSAGGVSNNRYTQFNVGPSGVILNNSGASSQTQLGGQIGGNPLLGRSPATVILNQVTAANPSRLMGMMEVAGGRASVIVANPAGITCDGCGFLNANRATLTTGHPMMGVDGSLHGFDIAGGAITFDGQGLYGTNLERVDIWARSLALNAQVWADHLDVVGGAANVDYLSGNATAKNAPGPAPAFALDVAALGGMYANSIRLVGTEAGVGVNVGGHLAASGSLELTAQGDVRIASKAHVQAAGPMALRTTGTLANAGVIAADGGLSAEGQRLENSGVMIVDHTGNAKANTAGLQLAFAEQRHSGTLSSAQDIRIEAERLNVEGGLISAQGALTLTARGLMEHDQAELYGNTVALQAGALHITDSMVGSDADLQLRVDGLLRNQGSTLMAQRDLTLAAGQWDNAGLIHADQTLSIRSERTDNQQAGRILAGAQASVHSDVLNNAGLIQADQTLSIHSGRADNQQTGQILAGAQASVHSDVLNNAGLIQADQALSLRSERVDNQQTGRILAGTQASLHSDVLNNAGLIQADQALSLRSERADNQQTGRILAGTQASLHSDVLNNAGLIDSATTRLQADEIVNTGKIYGDTIAIQANTLRNDKHGDTAGVIAARGDLDLGVASLVNREHALIYVGGDLRLGGELDAGGHAKGVAQSVENNSATIDVAGDATIRAVSLKNLNSHYESELAQVGSEPKGYYIVYQTTEMIPAEETWLCHYTSGECSQDFQWLGDDGKKRIVRPSQDYPVSRYGPPFDYSPRVQFSSVISVRTPKPGVDGPIALNYHEAYIGGVPTDTESSTPTQIVTRYKPGEKIWSVFGVTEPEVMPEPVMACQGVLCKETEASTQLRAAIAANNDVHHAALDAAIRSFNYNFYMRLHDKFYYIEVQEVTFENRTVNTDPGKILVGGNATIQAAVFNDKSQIAAGGQLNIDGPAVVNQGVSGTNRVEQTGKFIFTGMTDGRERDYSSWEPYTNTRERVVELEVATAQGSLPSTPGKLPPAKIVELRLPGEVGVRVPILPPVVPDNAMFRLDTQADAPYLVATDAQFLGQRAVVSSDELLRALNTDSTHVLKRLGDGFYEQQLVAQQILLATGQRLTGDYTSGEEQYRALLLAGAAFADKHQLTIGAALNEAQMAALTGDIVWLVEQTIVLPDGSTHKVLSPQVYLMVKPGDLKGDGTLIAGRDLNITSSGTISNSGTLAAGQRATLQAKTIQNTVGTMQAAHLALNASEDILNQSCLLKGDTVSLAAGRDITLESEATRFGGSNVKNTAVTGVSRVDAGELSIKAGRDLNAQAALISASGDASLQAGRDINLTTLTESFDLSWRKDARNHGKLGVSEERGTQLVTGGNLKLVAGQDVNARAATVNADGALAVGAGRDINLVAGESTEYASTELYRKKKGFLSSSSRHTIDEFSTTLAQGTSVSADSVTMMAGRDVNILGSDIAAEHDLLVSAARDLTIAAAQNTFEDYHYEQRKKSGFLSGGGGLSISVGKQEQGQKNRSVVTQAAASTVGSVSGDVLLIAGNDYVQRGSNVVALSGDIDILGRNVAIEEARDASLQTEQSWFKQTGLTIGVSNPVVSLGQTISAMAKASGKTNDGRMKLLAAATVGLAAKNAYDATNGGDPAAAASVNISISLGTSKSSSQSTSTSNTAAGSQILAGGDLTILASGAGQDSDITVTGSKLSAGGNAILKADGDILLQAAKNVADQHSTSKSSGGSIGVGLSVGAGEMGVSVGASVHTGRGKSDGDDTYWTNTQITAGDVLALQSGGDTTLRGASGEAERILASVGGNLLIESLQDTSSYKSKNQSASVGVSVCVVGLCGNSISANASQTKMDSQFASVTEQSGLWAGDGGFQIDVGKNTSLIGGLIASNDQAILDGLNRLDTGTLVVKDIENKAEYSASSVGVGGGYNFGGGSQTKDDLGVNQQGEVTGGANAVPGTSVPQDKNGLSVGMPMAAGASGSASSTTLSAISEGQITIRDEAGQQALTGKTAAETIAELNRDTEDTLNSLSPIFNKEEIEVGFEIVGSLTREVGIFLTNRAKEADALSNAIAAEIGKGEDADPQRLVQLVKELDNAQEWGPGGQYRLITTALIGGAAGNVTGSTGQFLQASAVNYLQGLAASEIKSLTASLGSSSEANAARAALHTIVGCAAGAAKGDDCGSAALGAGASSVVSALLGSTEGLTAKEREARIHLTNSLVAGIALGIEGTDVAQALSSSRLELENNSASQVPKRSLKAIQTCMGNTWCAKNVVSAATVQAIEASKANYKARTPGLSDDQASILAFVEIAVQKMLGTEEEDLLTLPGKEWNGATGNEALPPSTLPEEQGGTHIPGKPVTPQNPITVPGQENNGPQEGTIIATPIPEPEGPGLVFNETTRFISGVTVVDKLSKKVFEGTVDLGPTLDRIEAGISYPHSRDGSTFRNNKDYLPVQEMGYYTEYVHPTPGVSGPGPQRIVTGKNGEVYYTPDHYETFIPLK